MECPIQFDTVKSVWSIVYIEQSQVIISINIVFLSLELDFVLSKQCQTLGQLLKKEINYIQLPSKLFN